MIKFKVTPDGADEFIVTAESRDILTWERVTKGVTFQGLMENMSMIHMFRIAYFACKRQGLWDGNEKDFESSVDITPTSDEAPDPTNQDQ